MALPTYDTQAFATNPQQWIQPYGQGLAGLAAQQLGRPIDTGAMTAGVAGPGAFTQAQQQLTSDMGGLGDIQRDATGQISGFTGGTGIASFHRIYKVFKIKSYSTQQATKPTCHRINKM